jgi:magnesium chelatase subunit I
VPAARLLPQSGATGAGDPPARPLHAACKKLGAKDPAAVASALEFVLEGLHLSRKLNKDKKAGQTSYRG